MAGDEADAVIVGDLGETWDYAALNDAFRLVVGGADLIALQDWYGPEEKVTARRYRRLERLLRTSLSDLEGFKVGERDVDVYVIGKTPDGEFAGIATKAVET